MRFYIIGLLMLPFLTYAQMNTYSGGFTDYDYLDPSDTYILQISFFGGVGTTAELRKADALVRANKLKQLLGKLSKTFDDVTIVWVEENKGYRVWFTNLTVSEMIYKSYQLKEAAQEAKLQYPSENMDWLVIQMNNLLKRVDIKGGASLKDVSYLGSDILTKKQTEQVTNLIDKFIKENEKSGFYGKIAPIKEENKTQGRTNPNITNNNTNISKKEEPYKIDQTTLSLTGN